MDEICKSLEHRLHSRFCEHVSECKGRAFLTGWERKRDAEVGRLFTPDETVEEQLRSSVTLGKGTFAPHLREYRSVSYRIMIVDELV